MELVLLILKIILIVFLVVLSLAVLALNLILFVPIHYEVSGSITDSGIIQIKGKVSYLLSIIKMLCSYEKKQFDVKFFLFGFEKKLQSEDIDEDIDEAMENEVDETADEAAYEVTEKSDGPNEAERSPWEEKKIYNESEEKSRTIASEGKPQKESKKKNKGKNKVDVTFIKQQLTDEHNRLVVRKVWAEFCYLVKHFKHRKVITDLIFSLGDPATTGQVLGVLCMIPALYQYEFKIVPDFEADEAYIKGTFLVAGKVRLIHVLITILRLIFDKEVRLVVKRILTLLEK